MTELQSYVYTTNVWCVQNHIDHGFLNAVVGCGILKGLSLPDTSTRTHS